MKNQKTLYASLSLIVIAILVIALFFFSNRGYGKVSREAYELAKALVGACSAESVERLDIVEQIIDETENDPTIALTDRERTWLRSIIRKARNGNWEAAEKRARRMLIDQVDQS